MECFICKEDKEQLLAIDNKKISFKEVVCFPCVVKKLKEEKQRQATELMKEVMGIE